MVQIVKRTIGDVMVLSSWEEITSDHIYTETDILEDGKQYGRIGSENPLMKRGIRLSHLIRTQPEALDEYYEKSYSVLHGKYPQYKSMKDVEAISGRLYVPVEYMQEEGRSQ